ncbi:MAG: RNA chaperone Hfq [Candidatus Eremiobacteraeota bacterium]|nr:RNA chaperone Hfq [Candidatus Eremiobacteraeota bacterium]
MDRHMLNLQDAFLSQLKKEGQVVAVFLAKGVQLKGIIRGYDNFTIFLEDQDGRMQMVYKHSITTVSPTRDTSDGFLRDAFKDSIEKKSPLAR